MATYESKWNNVFKQKEFSSFFSFVATTLTNARVTESAAQAINQDTNRKQKKIIRKDEGKPLSSSEVESSEIYLDYYQKIDK